MLGLIVRSKSRARLSCKWIASRHLSTKQEPLSLSQEIFQRRFVKPLTDPTVKSVEDKFLCNLFSGVFDTKVFEYPPGIENGLDTVLRHSFEIENYLNNIPRDKKIKDISTDLQKFEVCGLSVPQKYGGAGYTHLETVFLKECMGVNQHIGRFLTQNEDFGAKIVTLYGTEEQKQEYLPKIAAGKCFVSFAYQENGPLIDFSSFEGVSFKDITRQGFLINAKKKWVFNADVSDLILVLAKTSVIEGEDFAISLDCFLVEKNTPGVTIHGLNSKVGQELGIHEIDFKNVLVPEKNLIGDVPNRGHEILKTTLLHSCLSEAAFCSALLKKMVVHAMKYSQENKQGSRHLIDYEYIQAILVSLNAYAYAVESTIYLVAGRLDSNNNTSLLHESLAAKILAVDLLGLAIEKYVQMTGRDGFLSPGILDEALRTLHYFSVFNENNTHLKLLLGGDGLINSANPLVKKVKKLRNKHDNPWDAIKWSFSDINKRAEKKKLKLKLELHCSLQDEADLLELSVGKLEASVEEFFIRNGNEALKDEASITKFSEMAVYIYALTACIARASTSVCNDVNECENELKLAKIFANIACGKIDQRFVETSTGTSTAFLQKEVGEWAFKNKTYPPEHPLARTY